MDYKELERLISELEGTVQETSPQKGYWKQWWDTVREIGAAFKGTRFPARSDKDAAWQRFQSLVEQAKLRGAEAKERMKERERQFQERKDQSERARRGIEGQAASARPDSGIDRVLGRILLLPAIMERLLEVATGNEAKSELEEMHEDLKRCSQQLKDAWQTFSASKDAMLPADKAEAYRTLKNAQERLDLAWDRWKSAKTEHRESQRRAWEERQRERQERQQQREMKHEQFVDRVRANIQKLEGKLDRARDALNRRDSGLRLAYHCRASPAAGRRRRAEDRRLAGHAGLRDD